MRIVIKASSNMNWDVASRNILGAGARTKTTHAMRDKAVSAAAPGASVIIHGVWRDVNEVSSCTGRGR